jgi:hypothetical protein
MGAASGSLDYSELGFIARFDLEATMVEKVRGIQRRRWLGEQHIWVIEPHWPSLRVLLRLANQHNWEISQEAREAARRVKEDGESYEYSVDVVQGSYGEPWFRCMLGDDDALPKQVALLPQAYTEPDDNSWWVPAFRRDSCAGLKAIVDADERIELSSAAQRLLDEPDESYPDLVQRSEQDAEAEVELEVEIEDAFTDDARDGAPED